MKPTARTSWQLTALGIIMLALGNVALALWLPLHAREVTIASEINRGCRIAKQILAARNGFIETVVLPLLAEPGNHPPVGAMLDPTSIVVASHFALGDAGLKFEEGARATIVSPYPWSPQKTHPFEPFSQAAWTALSADPTQVVVSEERDIDGHRGLRVAVADRMTSAACLSCHNGDAQSPKRDWAIGDVAALMQVDRIIEPALAAAATDARRTVVIVGSLSLALSLILLVAEHWFATWRTQHLVAEARIRFLAFHDPMTGLLNRARFNDLFRQALDAAGEQGGLVALHVVDLDRFKAINDIHGHAAGDDVIRIAASRLQTIAGAGNFVGRFGGDEFLVAQCNAGDPTGAKRMAGTIVAAMSQPFVAGARHFVLSASVGVRLCQGTGEDVAVIYKSADKALYKAKQHGRDGFAVYDDALDKALSDRRRVEQRLRAMAADADEVTVVYQPLCDVRYGEVKGFEALLRMNACADSTVPADVFVSIAEELGLIVDIGAHVMSRALRFATTLPDHLTIAVNVSPQQFLVADVNQSIVAVTRRALAASGLDPSRLELEITEGLFLQATDHVKQQLLELKALGVSIALDDFGVGYCSLAYLSRFPVDKLKIDKSFLNDALARPDRLMPILETIATLGRKLGLTVVAEGIEAAEQAEIAERVGCQQLQGYYFCRPIEEVDIAAYLVCNTLGTKALKRSDAANDGAGRVSFWARLPWTETSGTWAPARPKAAAS